MRFDFQNYSISFLFFFLVSSGMSQELSATASRNYGWEIKTPTGESYSPPKRAITLQDHNAAFVSSKYCVDVEESGLSTPNGFVGDLCEQCPTCVWKKRDGFTTEDLWQTAVTTELTRLLTSGRVGTWIAEAPPSMVTFATAFLKQLGSHVGASLNQLVISGSRRFFVVTGTASRMEGLLEAGFSSVTPIPPQLKVDPVMVEAAAAASAATMANSSVLELTSPPHRNPHPSDVVESMLTEGGGLYVKLAPPPPPEPPLLLSTTSSPFSSNCNNDTTTTSSFSSSALPSSAVLLSAVWDGAVKRRVGHTRAQVIAARESVLTVHGLSNSIEAYAVALELATQGEVHWVSFRAPLKPQNHYASKLVQHWRPTPLPKTSGMSEQITKRRPFLSPPLLGLIWENSTTSSTQQPLVTTAAGRRQRDGSLFSRPSYDERAEKEAAYAKLPWQKNQGPLHFMGIQGQGQVVGVADTGLDDTSCFFSDSRLELPPKFEPLVVDGKRAKNGEKFVFYGWESEKHRKIRQYVSLLPNRRQTELTKDDQKDLFDSQEDDWTPYKEWDTDPAGEFDEHQKNKQPRHRRRHVRNRLTSTATPATSSSRGERSEEIEDSKGHGTHVCGTVVGHQVVGTGGAKAKGMRKKENNGVAFEAKLAFFNLAPVLQSSIGPYDPTPSYHSMFHHAYRVGARVFSLSFAYQSTVRKAAYLHEHDRGVDEFCYNHQDFIVLAAAGNYGIIKAANEQGEIEQVGVGSSIVCPSTAKNVVSVGSHGNLDPEKLKEGIPFDVLSEWSSRGPTVDGRIKPDVLGPGESVRSAEEDPINSGTCSTVVKHGTSMATPVVAGVTVLIRQYFMEGFYPTGRKGNNRGFMPMGALLKAILVNSARPVHVADSSRSLKRVKKTHRKWGGALPNNDQGWGGVDVSTTLITPWSPEGLALVVRGEWTENCKKCPNVKHGKEKRINVKIMMQEKKSNKKWWKEIMNGGSSPSMLPLKVTLVWWDKDAVEGSKFITLNNLDLTIQEGKQTFYPNGLSGPDTLNTVEHITIQNPKPGATYSIVVKGKWVVDEKAFYSLVISGPPLQEEKKKKKK